MSSVTLETVCINSGSGHENKCPICLGVLRKAVSTECNHVFCKQCLNRSKQSLHTCPICRTQLPPRKERRWKLFGRAMCEPLTSRNPNSFWYTVLVASGIALFLLAVVLIDRAVRRHSHPSENSGSSSCCERWVFSPTNGAAT
ncbi:uncharacterized protein LOC142343940 [Convolutriloba macropyga]|uniref:uncharacterized protein LOC142343940 n=1 Tax=Convolutriloba macropyga TaxID=536237 RepID=UPI003F51C024